MVGFAIFQIDTKNKVNDSIKPTIQQSQNSNSTRRLDNKNCIADECLDVENLNYPLGYLNKEANNALDRAIDDEYKAYATYQSAIKNLGMIRPFAMIVRAEEQHISSLKSIYDKYGLAIPQNMWEGKIEAPQTFKAACQSGVDGEIANIELYKDILPDVRGHKDIEIVFTNLMNASEQKHLPAFEKCN